MNHTPKILLVDDEKRFTDSLQNILRHYDYNCFLAHSGHEALKLLDREQFDLALLDVGLPDMSGCDVAEHISTSCPKTTSIMLTGINTVQTAVHSLKLGAYDFLSKPLNHDLLIKTLEKALQHNTLKRELQTSNERFKALSEAAWESVVIHEDGKIIEANQQFFDMFGYSREDLNDGLALDLILIPTTLKSTQQLFDYNFNLRCNILGLKKDGTELYVEAKSRTIIYQSRQRQVCTICDISDRITFEDEKRDLQNKLAQANKLNALGLMAGSVAHDLNNILAGVVSYPDLLLMQMEESDKYYNHIKKIQSAGKRAAAVVSDLVTIARGRKLEKSVENLNDIVHNYLNSLEHSERQIEYPNVVIRTKLHRNLHNSCCSAQHIHKILLNLIGNGLEAVQDNGAIHISTENCIFTHPMLIGESADNGTDYVKLTITDTGPGIDEDHIEHIFEPFYSTKVMGQSGTGLGLSIVWNIVQDHCGWVEVKNTYPGVSFEIYLPSTHDKTCPVAKQFDVKELKGQGQKILIVDDQAEQNLVIEKSLKKIGYNVTSVTSGEAGIAFLQSNDVDLMLLDMVMGEGLNGRETLEIIRNNKPALKVIVVSGYAQSDEIRKIKGLGVSLFLEKPITLSTLAHSIQNAILKN
ncbi:response regulator [Desulfopila sp. IMCC35008]|uniref:hybrid sensor histidine kinase/response regulator n=1 Tax=Desulfopila sp. IMCC35008 TaxID=2653858 RepID=UPI0013D167FE|nr:response regulator [Desulfopila sp. IMCC35008]